MSDNEIGFECSQCKHKPTVATFVWFVRPSASANEAAKEGTEEARLKPDHSGATSRMWIDGARPRTGEHPLVTTEKISNLGEDLWTATRRRSDTLMYHGEYL